MMKPAIYQFVYLCKKNVSNVVSLQFPDLAKLLNASQLFINQQVCFFLLIYILFQNLQAVNAELIQPSQPQPAINSNQPGEISQPGQTSQPVIADDPVSKSLLEQGVAPELLINKNLMTDALKNEYNKEQIARFVRNAMNNGNLAGNDAEVIKKYVKYQVYSMSIPGERSKMRSLRLSITRSFIDTYEKSPAKELYLREVALRCKDLMDNHLSVRIQAAMTMVELNIDKGNLVRGIPQVPYAGHLDIINELLKDPTLHQSVKVQFVTGIERICSLGRQLPSVVPKVDERYKLTTILLQELDSGNKYHWWYRKNIIRCLPELTIINDLTTQRPVVTEMLVKFLRNKQEEKLVRAEAAKSIGRLLLDSNHHMDVLVTEIVKFGLEMGVAYNQNLTDPTYRDVFWTIYLAFHPENPEEQKKQLGLLEQVNKVTLAGSKTIVENGYQQILMIVNTIFIENVPTPGKPGKPIDPAKLKAVSDWLKANPPKQASIHANSPPLK